MVNDASPCNSLWILSPSSSSKESWNSRGRNTQGCQCGEELLFSPNRNKNEGMPLMFNGIYIAIMIFNLLSPSLSVSMTVGTQQISKGMHLSWARIMIPKTVEICMKVSISVQRIRKAQNQALCLVQISGPRTKYQNLRMIIWDTS